MAPIPNWVKMVWMSIKSYQGYNGHAWPSQDQIGERVIDTKGNPMDKGQVSRAVKILIEHGFLKSEGPRNYTCLMPGQSSNRPEFYSGKVDEPSTNGLTTDQQKLTSHQPIAQETGEAELTTDQPKLTSRQPKVDEPSTQVDEPSTRSKKEQLKITQKETGKENTDAQSRETDSSAIDPEPARTPEDLTAEEIVGLWNDFAGRYSLATVRGISDKRRAKIRTHKKRIAPLLPEIFHAITESDFLLGKNGRWKVGFDFLFANDTNYLKILEGNYASANRSRQQDLSDDELFARTMEALDRQPA